MEGSFARNHRVSVWLQTAALQLMQTLLPRCGEGRVTTFGANSGKQLRMPWEWLLTLFTSDPIAVKQQGKKKAAVEERGILLSRRSF